MRLLERGGYRTTTPAVEIPISADLKDHQKATDIPHIPRTISLQNQAEKYSTISPNYLSGQAREAEKIKKAAQALFFHLFY
jgi:hypothetical protein